MTDTTYPPSAVADAWCYWLHREGHSPNGHQAVNLDRATWLANGTILDPDPNVTVTFSGSSPTVRIVDRNGDTVRHLGRYDLAVALSMVFWGDLDAAHALLDQVGHRNPLICKPDPDEEPF